MEPLRKIVRVIIDIFEKYLPATSFLIMFVVFIVQIFYRYILQSPLSWTVEITQLAYIWTIFLGACLVARHREHICFSIVYDLVSERSRAVMTIIASALIVCFLLISVPATLEYFEFLTRRKTNVLYIPFSIAYFPYLVFLTLTTLYGARDIWNGIQVLVRIRKEHEKGSLSV